MPLFVVFGALSDRIGRKRIMMTGMALAAVFYRADLPRRSCRRPTPAWSGCDEAKNAIGERTLTAFDAAGEPVAALHRRPIPNYAGSWSSWSSA